MNFQEIKDLTDNSYAATFSRYPVCFTGGKGITLYDTEGKTYRDFLAGIAVNALGYGDEEIASVLAENAHSPLHLSNLFYSEHQAKFISELIKISGYARGFLCNSGAEANEGAYKLARKYFSDRGENRYEFITAYNSFHGRTFATMTLTGQEKYSAPYKPLLPGVRYAEYNNLESFEAQITEHTAAVLLEPVQGEGGVLPCSEDFLQGIVKLCKQQGLLLIMDEVQTGMGRTGSFLCCERFGVRPDIVTLSKALGGGLPLGAILIGDKLKDVFTPGSHGTTFGGNPLACAVGLVVLKRLQSGLINHVNEASAHFLKRLKELGSPRGFGLLLGLPLKETIDGKQVVQKMLERGFILNCAGHNTLRFVPPLIVTSGEIDEMIDALKAVLNELGGN